MRNLYARFCIRENPEGNDGFAANSEIMKINNEFSFCNFISISRLWNVGENKLRNYRFGVLISYTKPTPPGLRNEFSFHSINPPT